MTTVTDWSINHPVTGQKVAGAVVVWSPSSRAMSENMLRKINQKPSLENSERLSSPDIPKPNQVEEGLEPVIVDTTVF